MKTWIWLLIILILIVMGIVIYSIGGSDGGLLGGSSIPQPPALPTG